MIVETVWWFVTTKEFSDCCKKLLKENKTIEPEIQEIINENYWDLI